MHVVIERVVSSESKGTSTAGIGFACSPGVLLSSQSCYSNNPVVSKCSKVTAPIAPEGHECDYS